MKDKLRYEEQTILHLLKYIKYENEFVVPSEVTQSGIAEALKIHRNNVPRIVNKLCAKGFVYKKRARVADDKIKKRVYFLTELGRHEGMRLQTMLVPKKEYVTYPEIPSCNKFIGREDEIKQFHEFISSDSKMFVVIGLKGIGKTTYMSKCVSDYTGRKYIYWHTFTEWTNYKNFIDDITTFLRAINSSVDDLTLSVSLLPESIFVFDDIQLIDDNTATFFRRLVNNLDKQKSKIVFISSIIPKFYSRLHPIDNKILEIYLGGLTYENSTDLYGSINTTVYNLTEGHPAALKLLKNRIDLDMYLNNEICKSLTVNEIETLKTLSVFRFRIIPQKMLTNIVDLEILDTLVDKNLVTRTKGNCYIVPNMLKQFLRVRVDSTTKIKYDLIASEYCLSEGKQLDALLHLIDAKEYDKSVDVVAKLIDDATLYYSEECIECIDRLLEMKKSDPAVLLLKGDIFRMGGHLESAKKCYLAVKEVKDTRYYSKSLRRLSALYCEIGEINESLSICMDLVKRLEKEMDDSNEKYRLYMDIGNLYILIGDIISAIRWYQRCFDMTDALFLARLYNSIGSMISMFNTAVATDCISKSIEINHTLSNTNGLSWNYLNMGFVKLCSREFSEALKFLKKSLKIKVALNHLTGVLQIYNMFGHLYYLRSLYEPSKQYYTKVISNVEHKGSIAHLYALSGLAVVCSAQKNYTDAVRYSENLINLAKIDKFKGIGYQLLGFIYREKGDFELSSKNLKKSINYLQKSQIDLYKSYMELHRMKDTNLDLDTIKYINDIETEISKFIRKISTKFIHQK